MREIVLAVDVTSERKDVMDALTTTEGLAAFWTPDVSSTTDVGGTLRFGFEAAPADLEVELTALDAGSRVEWACHDTWPHWEGTRVEWRLGDAPEGGTRIVFRHDGWPDDRPDFDLGSIAHTWGKIVHALERYLETGDPQPALR